MATNNANPQQTREYYVYLPSTKQRVPVNKDVYLEYYRPIWRHFKAARRHGSCCCTGNRWWLCTADCSDCLYCRTGDVQSLEHEREVCGDIRPDETVTVAEVVEDQIYFQQLLNRLAELMPEASRIGELRLDDLSEREIADLIGIPRNTFRYQLKKARAQLEAEFSDLF